MPRSSLLILGTPLCCNVSLFLSLLFSSTLLPHYCIILAFRIAVAIADDSTRKYLSHLRKKEHCDNRDLFSHGACGHACPGAKYEASQTSRRLCWLSLRAFLDTPRQKQLPGLPLKNCK